MKSFFLFIFLLQEMYSQVGIGTKFPYSQLANTSNVIQGWRNTSDKLGGITWTTMGSGFSASFYGQQIQTGGVLIKVSGTTDTTYALQIGQSSTQTGIPNPLFTVIGNGRIGVGTYNPGNRLEITHGILGNSGLRFTQLNSTSSTILNNGLQLSVNSFGDVILTPDAVNANRAWSTTGNAGFNTNLNFIGTTDLQPIVFRTNNVERMRLVQNGSLGIGTNNPIKTFHVQAGGTSLLNSSFGDGLLFSSNAGAGCRIFLEHLTAPTDLKTSVIYTQLGTTIIGGILNDNGNTWLRPNPISVSHTNGNVGINTTVNTEQLTINGAIKIGNNYSGVVNGASSPVPTGGAGTIIFNGSNFFGWNGNNWKQLDN